MVIVGIVSIEFAIKCIRRILFRFVQNIVFYGISQNTGNVCDCSDEDRSHENIAIGSWLKNPYISFGIAAVVEIAAYIVVHLTLDRLGRKITYCSFVFALALVALLVVPIQMFLPKDSQSIRFEHTH
jgi:hypothetical protein